MRRPVLNHRRWKKKEERGSASAEGLEMVVKAQKKLSAPRYLTREEKGEVSNPPL